MKTRYVEEEASLMAETCRLSSRVIGPMCEHYFNGIPTFARKNTSKKMYE
jgi:hypothetical protein